MFIKFQEVEAQHLNSIRTLLDIRERAAADIRNIFEGYLRVLLKVHGVPEQPWSLRPDGSGLDIKDAEIPA
jgi:hypothetical protein